MSKSGLLGAWVGLAMIGCDREPVTPPRGSEELAVESMTAPSGEITWYTLWSRLETDRLISAFNERHPDVQVTAMQLGSSEKIARIRAEHRSGVNEVDVISIMVGLFAQPLAEAGILARYRPRTLDEYPTELAERILHEHWTVMAVIPHGICYNTETVEIPPTSYEDLLSARFKGQIVLSTPLQISSTRNFLIETHGYWGEEKWRGYWVGLAAHDVLFTSDGNQGIVLLTRAERGVFLACNTSLYISEMEEGAPLDWVAVEPNVATEVVLAIAEESDNPTAARAFYDFVLSRNGQTVVGEAFGLQPVHPNAILPDVVEGAADTPIIFSPSEFQIERLRSDPGGEYYERFVVEVFGLR